jgi:hypothetical protein
VRLREAGEKSYAAPRAGDGIDSGHIELSVARLFFQCIKLLTNVHVTVVTVSSYIVGRFQDGNWLCLVGRIPGGLRDSLLLLWRAAGLTMGRFQEHSLYIFRVLCKIRKPKGA